MSTEGTVLLPLWINTFITFSPNSPKSPVLLMARVSQGK